MKENRQFFCKIRGILLSFLECIILGSQQGILRIYNFKSQLVNDGSLPSTSNFTPECLLLEKDLGEPILQLATGLFVS